MIDKRKKPTKLLWIDLEMTGLEPKKDVILEIAAEITDFNFDTLATYEASIKHPKSLVVKRMQKNVWWRDFPDNRDQFIDNLSKAKSITDVEQELITIIDDNFKGEPAVLAGNSIHSDRLFIKEWMPMLDIKLHYRMLDVTSFKILMQGKYGKEFLKPEVHRAFEDIQGSIAELEYYLEWFNKQGNK